MPGPPTQSWRPHGGAYLSILFDVFALGQRVRTLLRTAMGDAGLRPDEYAAYSVVFEDGPVTMTELSRQLGMPLTTAADYARTMVQRRHARRDPHPSDQRATVLTLTPSGLRAHRRASWPRAPTAPSPPCPGLWRTGAAEVNRDSGRRPAAGPVPSVGVPTHLRRSGGPPRGPAHPGLRPQ